MGRLAALVAATLALAGCSDSVVRPPTSTPVDNPTVSVSPPPSTTPGPGSGPVHVRASIGVASSPAVTALVTFVRAHADSVNAGQVTRLLASVTTPGELARQRRVVEFAVAQGYAVPTSPVLRVVSVLGRTATRQILGACFWLPSTEYRDAETGASPSGPVPKAWAPAVASVRLAKVTWSVDTLREPDNETTIRCGGSP